MDFLSLSSQDNLRTRVSRRTTVYCMIIQNGYDGGMRYQLLHMIKQSQIFFLKLVSLFLLSSYK